MALSLACAISAGPISSAYFVVWLKRTNDPGMTVSPVMDASLTGVTTETAGITQWITITTPSASRGVWNPSVTYALGDTVESAVYRMRNPSGSLNVPIVYRSRIAGNIGHSPEAFDGSWTCITQPTSGNPGDSFPVVPFAYALNPVPTPSTLASASWTCTLWHSLFSTVTAPGDVVQLSDMYILLNYPTVSTLSRPLTNAITGTQGQSGLIVNPGPQAQFECWHTSGLANFPTLTLNGFDPMAFVSGSQPNGVVGVVYKGGVYAATGGTPPYTYAVVGGTLPPGLALNASTGAVTGTPTAAGTYDFTVQVTDSTAATATVTCATPIAAAMSGGGPGSVPVILNPLPLVPLPDPRKCSRGRMVLI